MLLIFLSSFFGSDSKSGKAAKNGTPTEKLSSYEYCEWLENKIARAIDEMTGDSGAAVMVTLDTGVEYVYATEEKTDSANTTDDSAGKVSESGSNAKTYITVTDADGNEKAIVLTELVPRVRGVLIVCRGGDREDVAGAIRRAVSTALNISEKNINVSGRGK